MNYQAVLRNSGNQLITNQSVGMKISIIQGSASGSVVFTEQHSGTTNMFGIINLEIGGGTPVYGTFSGISWANGPYFVQIETDPTGGTNYTLSGTSELLSVPYALYSVFSGSTTINAGLGLELIGNTMNALYDAPMWNAYKLVNIPVATLQPAINDVLRYNGSAWVPSIVTGGSGTVIDCSTSSNSGYTIRGDGSSSWECTNAVYITSSGYVGIGTTSPSSSYNLTIGSNGFLVNGSSSTSNIYGKLRIGSTSSTSYQLQVDGQTYVTDGLRVGTSSSPPSSGILSSGDIKTINQFIMGSSSTGSGTLMIRTSSGELRPQSSTIKVKDNVQPLLTDKDKILSLRPVQYDLKPALGGGHEIGLIAEEVEQLIPELVVYGPARAWIGNTGLVEKDENGNEILDFSTQEAYSVHYDRLPVYLLIIIKEQEQRISELEKKVEALSK